VETKFVETCYHLALAAAKRRDLSAALRYAFFVRALDPGHDDAARLAELCLGELGEDSQGLEKAAALAARRKWARAARALPKPRSVRLLDIAGCLWALAGRRARAAECFAGALAKDRGDTLARDALAGLGLKRSLRRFFDPF
jgi:hypothetical protein